MTMRKNLKVSLRSWLMTMSEKYGKEVRAKYGDEVVNNSNAKIMGMSKEQYSN